MLDCGYVWVVGVGYGVECDGVWLLYGVWNFVIEMCEGRYYKWVVWVYFVLVVGIVQVCVVQFGLYVYCKWKVQV